MSEISSKLDSLRKSSSSNGVKSNRCRLLPKKTVDSVGENRVRFVTKSFSESRSEKDSKVGKPPNVLIG